MKMRTALGLLALASGLSNAQTTTTDRRMVIVTGTHDYTNGTMIPPISGSDPTSASCTVANALTAYSTKLLRCISGTWTVVSGSSGGSSSTTSALPALPSTVTGVLAYLTFTEGSGSTVTCVKGTSCGTYPTFSIAGSGGSWSGLGYYAASSARVTVPDAVANAAKSIIIVSDVGGTGYRALMGCGSSALLLDQSVSNVLAFNFGGGSYGTNRLPPGIGSAFDWSMGFSRMVTWTRGTNGSTDPDKIYLDNYRMPSSSAVANGSATLSGCTLGNETSDNWPLNNTIHQALFLDHAVTGTENAMIMQALKEVDYAKAVSAGLDTRNLLIVSGDSIPGGHTSTSTANDAVTALANLLSAGNGVQPATIAKWNILNSAVQGQTITSEVSVDATYHNGDNASSGYIPVYSPSSQYQFWRRRHVVFGCEQTNSVNPGGLSSSTIITGCQNWVLGRIQEGYEPGILITHLGTGGSGGDATTFSTVQTDLRANWSTYGARFLIDTTAIPQFTPVGTSNTNCGSSCFYDNVHFSPAGQYVFAANAAAKLAGIGVQ